MRILIGISNPFDKGSGIAAAAKALSEGLLAQGDELVIASPEFADTAWLARHGVSHVRTDPNEPQVDAARRVLNALSELRIDGVINNDNSVVQCLAPLCGVPFVSIMHLPRHVIGALAAYNSAYVDYVVAISPDMQRVAIEDYGLPVHKVPLVYNGVPDCGEGLAARAKDGRLNVIFAGGGNHRKGADLMLKLVRRCDFGAQELLLHWFDVLPESFRRELENVPFVRLHGRVAPNVFLDHLRSADVLLMPSRLEGCPMALLEAMCRGIVPIVSDGMGAMRWIVQSGHNGFVCSLRRWPTEAHDCLRHLLQRRRVLQEMSLHSRRMYVEGFTNMRMASMLRGLLQQPTVQREARLQKSALLKWTRPTPAPGTRASLWERFCFRAGLLRPANVVVMTEPN